MHLSGSKVIKYFCGKAKINHHLTNEAINSIKAKRMKKSQCLHCSEIFTNSSIKRHSENCQFYAKLIKKGLECSVCSKSFESRKDVNRHIGHNHKEAFSEIKQKSNLENKNELSEFCKKTKMDLPNETSSKLGLEISKEQNPGILENQAPLCSVILGEKHEVTPATQDGLNDVCEQEIDTNLEKTDLENPIHEQYQRVYLSLKNIHELNPHTVTGDLFLLCHGKTRLKKILLSVSS